MILLGADLPELSPDDQQALILVVLAIGFYLLPSLIAIVRFHHNFMAIAATNILLGWTFIGWAVALIWACTSPPPSRR